MNEQNKSRNTHDAHTFFYKKNEHVMSREAGTTDKSEQKPTFVFKYLSLLTILFVSK